MLIRARPNQVPFDFLEGSAHRVPPRLDPTTARCPGASFARAGFSVILLRDANSGYSEWPSKNFDSERPGKGDRHSVDGRRPPENPRNVSARSLSTESANSVHEGPRALFIAAQPLVARTVGQPDAYARAGFEMPRDSRPDGQLAVLRGPPTSLAATDTLTDGKCCGWNVSASRG